MLRHREIGIAGVLNWLDQIGMPRKMSKKVVEHWGAETRQKVAETHTVSSRSEANGTKVDAPFPVRPKFRS